MHLNLALWLAVDPAANFTFGIFLGSAAVWVVYRGYKLVGSLVTMAG